MRWNRLFAVLVLPALATGGCEEEDDAGDEAGEPATTGPTATDGGPATTGEDGAPATTDPGATTEPDPSATGEGSDDAPSTGGGDELECEGGANDPCGCLCCWVMDGCVNTDACCAGWSDCAPEPQ